MIIQEKFVFGLGDHKLFMILLAICTLGTLTAVALVLGAFIAVIYLIDLCIDAIGELATHLVNLYSHADSLGKVLLLLILSYALVKLCPHIVRSMRRSLHLSR